MVFELVGLSKLMDGKKKSSSVLPGGRVSAVDVRQAGRELQLEQIMEALKDIRGTSQPWDDPKWAPAIEGMRTQADRGMEGLTSGLTQAGVTGPAAGLALERGSQGFSDNILNLANQMRTGGNVNTLGVANLASNVIGQHKALAEQAEARKAATPSDFDKYFSTAMGGIGGALSSMSKSGKGGSGGGGCCFIFLEGDRLTDNVRMFRDEHFGKDSFVSRGYSSMARWLTPIMKRSRLFKGFVRLVMLNPLSKVADWYFKENKTGWIFIPIGLFWCSVWEYSARVKECMDARVKFSF